MNQSLDLLQPYTHRLDQLKIKPSARAILVSLEQQALEVWRDETFAFACPVSTGLKPPSNLRDSAGTPTGLHRVAEKIGHGAPSGTVFKGRVSVGQPFWELSEEEQRRNLVTTRILWLEGLEEGTNCGAGCDSHDRYIYIHGTNHEEAIGRTASGGCVQLRNDDMIELFEAVETADLVFIV